MKIAIIGSYSCKMPIDAGKIHAPLILAFNLAVSLAKQGNDVTYFGEVDRKLVGEIGSLKIESPKYFDLIDLKAKYNCTESIRIRVNFVYEQNYISAVIKNYPDFDLYYSWAASYIGSLAALSKKPIVATHHDSTNMGAYNVAFKGFDQENLFLIPISNFMKDQIHFSNLLDVIHHGMDPDDIPQVQPSQKFCWVGRVAPSKGLHIAIEAAIKARVTLVIAGPMHKILPDFGDISDYIEEINKLINDNGNIEYIGSISHQESIKLISESRGLIFPSDGTESFSMVTLEAIMAGTPVITTRKGPLPELISEGINGYMLDDENDVDGFASTISKIGEIDRNVCRKDAIERFSLNKMALGYEEQFKIALAKWQKNAKN